MRWLVHSAFDPGGHGHALLAAGSSVVVGVNKGIQSVMTFLFSTVAFCSDSRKNQCFGPWKGASLAVVVCGVLLYAYGTQRQRKALAHGDGWTPLKGEANSDEPDADSEVVV